MEFQSYIPVLKEYVHTLMAADSPTGFTRRATDAAEGLARGMGMAVGFTLLGAVLVILLQRLAQQNLPVIGDFLAQIVTIVQRRLE